MSAANATIPFYRPSQLREHQREWIKEQIEKVLKSGQVTNGEYARAFETEIKEVHNVEYAIACSSCTQGLWLVLEALKPDSIMVQSFTWASVQHILPLRPVTYCEINPETWLMNATVRTYWDFVPKAVIYTHTFGNMGIAPVDAEEQKVIYDGAYSLGADLPEIGNATVISTTATKIITSCEGGIILTNDDDVAKEIIGKELRDRCSRMSEVNAIVGLANLENLAQNRERLKIVSEYYRANLPFKPQKISKYGTNNGYYGCLVPNRDELIKKLNGKIETRIRYAPLKAGLPVTDEIAKQILILPCYPDVEEHRVVEIINEALQ